MKKVFLLLIFMFVSFVAKAQITLTPTQQSTLAMYFSIGGNNYVFSLGNICPQDLTQDDLEWMHGNVYNIDMPIVIMQPNKGLVFIHDNGLTNQWYKFRVSSFNKPKEFIYTGTTAQTATSLNSGFPTADVNDRVLAENVGSGMIYTKSTNGWLAQSATFLTP